MLNLGFRSLRLIFARINSAWACLYLSAPCMAWPVVHLLPLSACAACFQNCHETRRFCQLSDVFKQKKSWPEPSSGRSSEPARDKEHFSLKLCFVSKYDLLPVPALKPSLRQELNRSSRRVVLSGLETGKNVVLSGLNRPTRPRSTRSVSVRPGSIPAAHRPTLHKFESSYNP